jgi:hypothetical protein
MSEAKHTPLSSAEVRVKALRDGIGELISQCTDQQVAFLHRIHDNAPWKGLANIPDSELSATYDLLRRTVIGNIAKATGA